MTDHHIPPPWPADLQAICRNDCAFRSEPPCWKVDAGIEPHHAGYQMRGRVCDECWSQWQSLEHKRARDGLSQGGGDG